MPNATMLSRETRALGGVSVGVLAVDIAQLVAGGLGEHETAVNICLIS